MGSSTLSPDRPYADSISVKAVDDKTIEIRRKKGGKEVVL